MCRYSIQDGQKISFFDNGIISLPGLLNMFEVMPMLIGSELALKADENGEIFHFWEVCHAPLLSLHSLYHRNHAIAVLLSMMARTTTQLVVLSEEEEERRKGQ